MSTQKIEKLPSCQPFGQCGAVKLVLPACALLLFQVNLTPFPRCFQLATSSTCRPVPPWMVSTLHKHTAPLADLAALWMGLPAAVVSSTPQHTPCPAQRYHCWVILDHSTVGGPDVRGFLPHQLSRTGFGSLMGICFVLLGTPFWLHGCVCKMLDPAVALSPLRRSSIARKTPRSPVLIATSLAQATSLFRSILSAILMLRLAEASFVKSKVAVSMGGKSLWNPFLPSLAAGIASLDDCWELRGVLPPGTPQPTKTEELPSRLWPA